MPRYLVIFVLAWIIAQGAKYILEIRKDKSAKFKRIITESGGMPSSHSSVVIALATLVGLHEGVYSSIFGLAFVFAMIVIYDSMKVRFSNGIQAQRINEIIEKKNLLRKCQEKHANYVSIDAILVRLDNIKKELED